MKLSRTCLLPIYLFLSIAYCNAEPGVPRYVFSTAPAAGRQFPSLDRMSNGTLVLVYAERMGNNAMMSVCTSTNDGATWSDPKRFATVVYSTLGLQRRPRLQIDRDGVMHAVFEDVRGSQTIHVYHCASTDNGATWTTPAPVAQALVSPHEDFCSAAIDSTNRLVVTFLSEGIDATDELVHVYMVVSADKGATWTDPMRVDRFTSGGGCECCQQNITVAPSGEIAVCFRSNVANKRDVHLARSTDNGATFATPVLVQSQPWNIDQCPATGPSMCFDATGTLHISWWDARDAMGKAVAYYAKLAPGQTSTPVNVDLSSALGNEAEYPSVATSADGMKVTISFLTSMGTYITRSTNGGQSFIAEKIHHTFMNNSSTFTAWTNTGAPLTMWQAQRETVYDVMQFRDAPTSVDDDNSLNIHVHVDAGGVLHVNANETIGNVVVTDLLGRQIVNATPLTNTFHYTLLTTGLVVIQVQAAYAPHRRRCEVFSLYR